MKLVFKKIPKLAIGFYLLGFCAIAVALTNYFTASPFMSSVKMQQCFLIGAIVVAIGSVVNTLYQFGTKK